jgi:hypothetical protein
VSNWPKLTPHQRLMMRDFENTEYGDMHIAFSRRSLTVQVLEHHGLVSRGGGDWFSLTKLGRDYLRFVIHKRRASRPTPARDRREK